MRHTMRREWLAFSLALLMGLAWGDSASAQTVSGQIFNGSLWRENISAPPGNGDGFGQMMIQLKSSTGAVVSSNVVVATSALPFPPGPYSYVLGGSLPNGDYQVTAWVDGNENGEQDPGEPFGSAAASITGGVSVVKLRISVIDDNDADGLPDWWEYHWFQYSADPFAYGAGSDPDGDGLSNLEEYNFSIGGFGLDYLSPANWDSDDDGMDDGWECRYFDPDMMMGMNPVVANTTNDFDGDGLSDWQEYCGIDGKPRMVFDQMIDWVRKGKMVQAVSDDLSPIDIDSDFDMLFDSFESAWYDPANRIDPRSGVMNSIPTNNMVDTSIAREDSDQDGLSNYREQCLLAQLRQSSTNGFFWDWSGRLPFVQHTYDFQGKTYRSCTMAMCGGQALNLNLVMNKTIPASINRFQLRNHEWTDPTEGTGYTYVDEAIPPGHDTDSDGLPDGWEVQFGLDPRDDGLSGTNWDNGPFGDPDNDGLMNIEEYYGQDGNRFTTRPFINGTGDETNPNEYNWRPDTTYQWRWMNTNDTANTAATELGMGAPRVGTGISRGETLGSALPTTSVGTDLGTDSDDDGIPDALEINPNNGDLPSSPVDSCDPFIPRSALIISSNGISIPDPELAAQQGIRPAGSRADLQRRDWTLECQVKLLSTNLTGHLFDFQTVFGPKACIVYRLSLSNNAPVLVSYNSATTPYTISANALPTNRWVHLATVWDNVNNSLSLYIDGVLSLSLQPLGESFSRYMYPATNTLTLASSPNGSFTNHLMLDEVRIWGLARTPDLIAEFSHKLVPPVNGDDVWINQEGAEYYSHNDTPIVNGGSLFDGEPGVPLDHVYTQSGSFWIDNGNGKYNAKDDILLKKDPSLVEGLAGAAVGNVLWNDKDNSGNYSRNSLLAYYRFDDGGSTAEDFARRAKNGLLGATCEEYRFGDSGYALPTNSFLFVTNDPAPVYGVDKRGADDSDHDGLPDAWEIIHGLDPWDDGTRGESSPGAKDGPNGAKGDPDHDELINIYEYWSGTNPRAADSDGNGVLDSQEDRDGDGVVNITEQLLGSRPDMVDTDDDGFTDSEEQSMGTSPISAVDPAISRAVILGGSKADYLDVPVNINQRLRDWTLESWVMPSNNTVGAGIIARRVVENLAGGTQAVNFVMGLEPNGSGGLRLYAGYVGLDGKQYIVRSGTVLPAQWSHLAASYSQGNATLTLYTNGAVAASTNTFDKAPPISGRGGDTFVRIGEGFGGAIDEVRFWNKSRTGIQIQANTNRVISASDTNGLINYFRFDDGEANTNVVSWSEFHQPAGFQDFTYGNDWSQQWRHAAVRHGNILTMIPGAIIPPPSLRIILKPDGALLAGAQWSLDGAAWQNSGETMPGLSSGTHTVRYKPILGWTRPLSETIQLTNGVAVTFTRVYVEQATLIVTFDGLVIPPLAAWKVNADVWQQSGDVVSNLDAGSHIITYRPAPGYFEPQTEIVTLNPGETLQISHDYNVMTSAVSVIIMPTNAATAGARWRVDGGIWRASGEVASGLLLATHLIQFSDQALWITPANIDVTLTDLLTVVVTGRYSQVTGLSVSIDPPGAVAAGAQWRVSGGGWTNSGFLLPSPAGTYTVDFKPLSGWLTPGSLTAVVLDQQVTALSGLYYKADVFGGTLTTNAGDFYLPWGLDSDSLHRLFVADTFNDRIQMYDTLSQQWTVWGKFGTSLGQFKKPSGLAVDKLGNLYVADQSNHRIQKRIATNGQWIAVGSNTLVSGTALGQFNSPADVAVDSTLTLYVADTWNNRVQKMSSSGVWSVFITNGTTAGKVQYPQGLHVDSSDSLYVSDDGVQTNGLSRVQKFANTGQFITLLGGRDSSQGNLQSPGGMTIGNGNLYVANAYDSRVAYSDMTGMSWTTLVGSNVLSQPGDVEWDSRGYLYIADTFHSRILMIQIDPAAATNGLTQVTAMTSSGTNSSFTLSWFARLNWNYAVQYANILSSSTVWLNLPGYSAVSGMDQMTNCTDTTVLGVTNRFYRIIAY
ncbi:MAG: LamG-like jellyroll fold domain-containing protein [bacterium]